MSYQKLIDQIINLIGGSDNIADVYHCTTRLRFKLNDPAKADLDALGGLDGIMGAVETAGQTQVIVGQHVGEVYEELLTLYPIEGERLKDANEFKDEISDKRVSSNILDLIAGLFTPVLPLMTAGGVIKGLLTLCTALNWLSSASGEYILLNAIGDSFFYFIPVFLGYTAMKKFHGTPGLGAVIGAALVYPTLASITSGGVLFTLFDGTIFAMPVYITFFGIPVVFQGYSSSVIPVIAICAVAAPLERFLNSHVHAYVKSFVAPSITLLVSVTLGFLVIGPLVSVLSNLLGSFMGGVFDVMPALAGALYCGLIQVCVMFGVHWGFVAICLNNFATLGYDPVTICGMPSAFTLAGIALAIFARCKSTRLKGICMPACITALFGITEPALYGVVLQRKKVFVMSCLVSAIGGAIMGGAGAKQYVMAANGIFGWIQVIPPTGFDISVVATIAAFIVCFAAGFAATLAFWKKLDIE